MSTGRLLAWFAGITVLLFLAGGGPTAADSSAAKPSRKKAIWGPVEVGGKSQFPIYRDLGVGIYEMTLPWADVAPTQPAEPTNSSDPAYQWPRQIDDAVREGAKYGIRVSVQIFGSAPWANGGREPRWAPTDPTDFADFAEAAARRYPGVHYWMIWGEPSRRHNFLPLTPARPGQPLNAEQRRGPRLYARILDAAYGRLKHVSRRNMVIGGNTFTAGDILPLPYIRALRLPNGLPPRMDLYGHNPFSSRPPLLSAPLVGGGAGYADFSDLDVLARRIDRYLGRPRGRSGAIKIFISELFWPTDHANREFNFHVTRATQARWLSKALRITRSWPRIYTLGWLGLYDDPPNAAGDEVNRGLLDWRGRRKPSYYAYRRG